MQHLPEPARRFFLFVIKAGTPLWPVTQIRMSGEIALGTRDSPNYARMQARQIIAPPYGLVWNVSAGRAALRISGSDGFDGNTSWVRFWLLRTVPIVRAGGTADHARAAFGRVVAEAVFWAPAALLPDRGCHMDCRDRRYRARCGDPQGTTQTVDVTVAADSRPTLVVIPRWTNANSDKTYRLQPFGGYASAFENFAGYTLTTSFWAARDRARHLRMRAGAMDTSRSVN